MGETRSPHIVILPSPGMGHLIPLTQFAKRLLQYHRFAITLISQTTGQFSKAERAILDSLPKDINLITLPQLSPGIIPSDAESKTAIFLTLIHNFPNIRCILMSLVSAANPPVALVVDLLLVPTFDFAAELGIAPYLFYTSNCMALSFSFHVPTIDAAYQGAFEDMPEPVKLPGCVPLHGRDFMEPLHERGSELYNQVLHSFKLYGEAKGILVNSFEELEPGPVEALKSDTRIPPIYPIGPLVWTASDDQGDSHECLKWLNEQPRGSVLYVSFGSLGALTREQVEEMAWGLEMSGQRFLWIIRAPNDVKSLMGPLEILPEGFLKRTRDVGLVFPSWSPQMQVLSHEATGGFLTHCGWNSVLESIISAVPLIAWPLYAEQKMNAVLLVEDVKVALRPRACDVNGLVPREEISRLIKCLMKEEEGKKLRNRMREVSDMAARALKEGGSSIRSLGEIAREWEQEQTPKRETDYFVTEMP